MSADNPILIMTYMPTIEEAKHIVLSNLDTKNCEIEMSDKWYFICHHYIKFTFIYQGEINHSGKVTQVNKEPFGTNGRKWFTAKINFSH